MKILITGATGLIGKEIGKKLIDSGHHLVVTSRNKTRALAELPFPAEVVEWKGHHEAFPQAALIDVEAVINLAGESIASGRWNKKRKKEIYDSRILGTRRLVEAVQLSQKNGTSKVQHFLSASAIGIFGNAGDKNLVEDGPQGSDFLAKVCSDWEREAMKLSITVRVVTPRIGIVLSRQGGALLKMLPIFNLGIGGAIGSGKQWMSWIDLHDLVSIFHFCLENKTITGPVNAVAPAPASNKAFSLQLAQSLHKRLFFPVPGIILKVMLGEMSTLVLSSQRVVPKKLQDAGFNFKFPELKPSLDAITAPLLAGQKELLAEQWIPQKPEEVFHFFSNELNLEKLTPPFLNFKVLGKSTDQIQESTLIDYKLSLYGIPLSWRTKIEVWDENKQFVDMQLKGPYKKWHHTHDFIPYAGGTLLRDTVLFKLPMGFLGEVFSGPKVQSDVTKIFAFRRQIIFKEFHQSLGK
jgi:uncharacterized protein (TIGR01777 family)